MPRGDRTGPDGWGPRTGRGLGYCSGYDTPGFTRGYGRGISRGFGRGYGRGYGRGRGPGPYRFRDPAPYYGLRDDPDYPPYYGPGEEDPPQSREIPPAEEKSYLEDTLKSLEEEIQRVKDRLKKLE